MTYCKRNLSYISRL